MEDGQGEAFLPREEWLLAVRGRKRAGRCGCRSSRAPRGGLWSDMPHRDRSGRASWRIKGYTLASSGGDQWNGCIAPTSPKHLVEANDWIWEVPGNAALLLSAGGCGAMPGRVTRLRRAHSPLPASDRPHPGPIQGFKPLEVFRRATGSFKPPTARSRRATWPQIDFTNFSSGLV